MFERKYALNKEGVMDSKRIRFLIIGMVASVAAVLLVSCGGDGDNGGSTETGGTVAVTLQEWAVVPAEASVAAGDVTFEIENKGQETHEFVVIKTDLGALDLPTEDDGSVSETGEGMEVVDEAEDIPAGESVDLTVSLEPGHYVLICNILEEEEDGEHESHFQMGMRTDFEVE